MIYQSVVESFDLPPRELLRDRAYGALLDAIVRGELAPGQALHDVELAARLGLSRTPVREAVARLVDEGLVETKANAYTRVAPLDDATAREAAVVTQSLQGLAARLAAADGRFTARHADEARRANRDFSDALDAGDLVAALVADDRLHDVFIVAAGNVQLAAALDRLAPLLRRHELQRFASLPGRRSVQQHRQLVDAAAAGDVARAGALAEQNWATLVDLIDDAAERPAAPQAARNPGADRAAR